VDTLIIDNRFNSGGYDGVALELASRFAPDGRKVYTKHGALGMVSPQTGRLISSRAGRHLRKVDPAEQPPDGQRGGDYL
jgi:hypothetical protein